jgi:hypothetical protein
MPCVLRLKINNPAANTIAMALTPTIIATGNSGVGMFAVNS